LRVISGKSSTISKSSETNSSEIVVEIKTTGSSPSSM